MGLTDLTVRKLAPQKRRYEVADGKGLFIRVAPSGKKSWIFRYPFEGIYRRMTLGQYPGIGLAEAREKHGQAMMDVQRGIDPGEEFQAAKAKRKAAPTFEDLVDEFWKMELSASPTGKERRRVVDKDATQLWKKRKVADITRRDAVILLDRVRKRAPVIVCTSCWKKFRCRHVFSIVSKAFKSACPHLGQLKVLPLENPRRMSKRF